MDNDCNLQILQVQQHNKLNVKSLTKGLPFDGSSIRLFRSIDESDMMMVPDLNTDLVKALRRQVKLSSGNTLQLEHLQVPVICSKCS